MRKLNYVFCFMAIWLYGSVALAQSQSADEFTQRLLYRQQAALHLPMLTPSGWVEDPELASVRRILHDLNQWQNNSNAAQVRQQVTQQGTAGMVKDRQPTKEQ